MPPASPSAREQALHLGYSEVRKEGRIFLLGVFVGGRRGRARKERRKIINPPPWSLIPNPLSTLTPPLSPPPTPPPTTNQKQTKGGSPPPRAGPS